MLRVLVVGPDPLREDLAATALGRPSVERLHVLGAEAAIAAARERHPHLIVLDLPLGEARALAVRLRKDERTRPTALVWLNRSAPPEVETDLRAAGVNAVVPVPIDPIIWDRRLEELVCVPARRTHSIPVRLRDWSRFLRAADECEATVVDIGARGVLMETPHLLELGAKVGMSFELPGDPTEVGVVGQVVRLAGEHEGRFRVGVEFLVYRGGARERIAAFVESAAPQRPGAAADSLGLSVRTFDEAQEWEEELRASELRKALILDSALDCIVTVDHEGRIIEFNAAARRTFGYTRSEVLGREVADTLVPPGMRHELRRRLRDFVLTGEGSDLGRRREATAMRADGSLFPAEIWVVPAFVKGRVLLTAYIRDLSERRRAERLAEARHRATQVIAESFTVQEAAPLVLEAVAWGLGWEEARLWAAELEMARTSELRLEVVASWGAEGRAPSGARDDLARRCYSSGEALWVEAAPAPETGAAIAVPVRSGGRIIGVLEARSAQPRPREEDWLGVLADVGSQIGLFIKRQRAESELQRLARYDSLTGLPNRSFFLDALDRTLSRAERRRKRAAVVFLDLDGFKAVNDRFGHPAGDRALQDVAERLRMGTRPADLVARIGGDEFMVLVHDLARPDDAALVARQLLDRLGRPVVAADWEVTLSASAGIAVYPEDGHDADTLMRHADLAMYRAKSEGKNAYRFFTAALSERVRERMILLDGLRAGLERDEFELAYHPIVRPGGSIDLEALLRWRHPTRGLLAPAIFIAQAEESGLILPIGLRVLRIATRFAAALARRDVRLAVNISARQFSQPDLARSVEEALTTSGLSPARLELELPEPALGGDPEDVAERLRVLRELGVGLALDNFGTGACPIPLLRPLGFRRLKIDRSLVQDLPGSREGASLVEGILALGRSLGLEVVAEGVETEAQRTFLEAKGCGLQGYLVSQPLAAADVEGFLARAAG